jgi:nucleotide-binding universal stress UspA family protein
MFNKILLCSDGSDCAMQAARGAARIAKACKAELVVLNVLDLLSSAIFYVAPEVAPPIDVTIRYAEEAQQATLDATGQVLTEEGAHFRCRKDSGHPVDTILCIAEAEHADLIVMGSRGLSGWQALLLGSNSEAVVHHAHCPVLIVRGAPAQFQHILLPSDASACAGGATRVGFELAEKLQADLTVLNVFEPAGRFAFVETPDPNPVRATEEDLAAEQSLTQVEESCRAIAREVDVPYDVHQVRGHAGEKIVERAASEKVDLIVMGSRGLGGFKRRFLGSVSDAVLHHAHCSVLIVR